MKPDKFYKFIIIPIDKGALLEIWPPGEDTFPVISNHASVEDAQEAAELIRELHSQD